MADGHGVAQARQLCLAAPLPNLGDLFVLDCHVCVRLLAHHASHRDKGCQMSRNSVSHSLRGYVDGHRYAFENWLSHRLN